MLVFQKSISIKRWKNKNVWQTNIEHFSLGYHGAIHAENTSMKSKIQTAVCVERKIFSQSQYHTDTQWRRVATLNNQRLFVSQWLPAARPVSLTACALSLTKCGANSRRWSNTVTGACITHISCAHTLMAPQSSFFTAYIRFLREGVDVVHALTSLAHILMQNCSTALDWHVSITARRSTINSCWCLAVTHIQQTAMVTTCTWLMAWWWWKTDGWRYRLYSRNNE